MPHLGSVCFAAGFSAFSGFIWARKDLELLHHLGGLILSLGEICQVASKHSSHPRSSLMVMSDLWKSIHLSGFLLALFSLLLSMLTLPKTDSADPTVSRLSQKCTLKAGYSKGEKQLQEPKREKSMNLIKVFA